VGALTSGLTIDDRQTNHAFNSVDKAERDAVRLIDLMSESLLLVQGIAAIQSWGRSVSESLKF
jgi:hypothetical protein